MQLEEAKKLRETWGEALRSPNLSKEYHLGAATGDYACTQCGKAGWGRD
jgi:hypothetical protein